MDIIDIMKVTGLTEDELLRLQNENVRECKIKCVS